MPTLDEKFQEWISAIDFSKPPFPRPYDAFVAGAAAEREVVLAIVGEWLTGGSCPDDDGSPPCTHVRMAAEIERRIRQRGEEQP